MPHPIRSPTNRSGTYTRATHSSYSSVLRKRGTALNLDDDPRPGERPRSAHAQMSIFGLNRWLQIFLTIIAGVVVAVLAWDVITRFMHILILLLGRFLLPYLLVPSV